MRKLALVLVVAATWLHACEFGVAYDEGAGPPAVGKAGGSLSSEAATRRAAEPAAPQGPERTDPGSASAAPGGMAVSPFPPAGGLCIDTSTGVPRAVPCFSTTMLGPSPMHGDPDPWRPGDSKPY
ncbi:MAG: hypothetical protein FJ087_06110 [Deltaproteobacteria bacterium]|nr:hypothetical protein [Deltaproteobacteria bacterium]